MANKSANTRFNGPQFQASQNLDDGDTMDFAPWSNANVDGVIVNNISHENDCDVTLRADSNGDGTYDRSVTLDSFSGSGVSQGNEIIVPEGVQLRISDTSSGSDNDYILTGEKL